jgi:hypothetical protein
MGNIKYVKCGYYFNDKGNCPNCSELLIKNKEV